MLTTMSLKEFTQLTDNQQAELQAFLVSPFIYEAPHHVIERDIRNHLELNPKAAYIDSPRNYYFHIETVLFGGENSETPSWGIFEFVAEDMTTVKIQAIYAHFWRIYILSN